MYVEQLTYRKPPAAIIVTIYKTPPDGALLRIFAERGEAFKWDNAQGCIVSDDVRYPDQPQRWFFTTSLSVE